MREQDLALLDELRTHLTDTLEEFKRKPYLPIWGELFCTLRDIGKLSQKAMQNTLVYQMKPVGDMVYEYEHDKFTALIPDMDITISMTLYELTEALQKGQFSPRKSH